MRRCFFTRHGLDNVNQTATLKPAHGSRIGRLTAQLAFEPGLPSAVGMPYLYVMVMDTPNHVLAHYQCPPEPSAAWTAVSLEFPVPPEAKYIRLVMRRNNIVDAPPTKRRAFYRRLKIVLEADNG